MSNLRDGAERGDGVGERSGDVTGRDGDLARPGRTPAELLPENPELVEPLPEDPDLVEPLSDLAGPGERLPDESVGPDGSAGDLVGIALIEPDLAVLVADDLLLDALGRGEAAPADDPLAALLAAWQTDLDAEQPAGPVDDPAVVRTMPSSVASRRPGTPTGAPSGRASAADRTPTRVRPPRPGRPRVPAGPVDSAPIRRDPCRGSDLGGKGCSGDWRSPPWS